MIGGVQYDIARPINKNLWLCSNILSNMTGIKRPKMDWTVVMIITLIGFNWARNSVDKNWNAHRATNKMKPISDSGPVRLSNIL